jgi:hypothetical protein
MRQRGPLSPPTPRRSTPIATTALRFSVRLDAEGATTARVIAERSDAPAEARSLLRPSGGPTQAGTTPCVSFRAVLGLDGGMRLEVELTCAAQRKRKASPTQV